MDSYKLYILLLFILTILSLIFCIITKVKLIDKYNYCNKSNTVLCNEPETIMVGEKEYITCKNAKKLNIKNNSGFIKYFLVPLISIIIVLSIGLIGYDINKGGMRFINLIIPIFSIIALIILIIFQIIFYFSYKKKCLDNTYQCNLVSNLELKNNNHNLGSIVNKCKAKTPKHGNRNHKIVKNFNHFLFAILIFLVYMILYNIDNEFDLKNFSTGEKFSDKINPLIYTIIVFGIFLVNVIVPNSIGFYVTNSLFVLLIIILLGCFQYYDVDFLDFCK